MIKKRLPPLDPLIAFEAAARLLSFTRAADELHLSQAAISQQIRNLEDSLQVKLFTRSHRAVQLTNEGREYQHTVTTVLTQLAGATMDIQNVEFSRQLVIGCDESFATQWLSARFDLLRALLPDIAGGATIATLALAEESGRWDVDGIAMTAKAAGGKATLDDGSVEWMGHDRHALGPAHLGQRLTRQGPHPPRIQRQCLSQQSLGQDHRELCRALELALVSACLQCCQRESARRNCGRPISPSFCLCPQADIGRAAMAVLKNPSSSPLGRGHDLGCPGFCFDHLTLDCPSTRRSTPARRSLDPLTRVPRGLEHSPASQAHQTLLRSSACAMRANSAASSCARPC